MLRQAFWPPQVFGIRRFAWFSCHIHTTVSLPKLEDETRRRITTNHRQSKLKTTVVSGSWPPTWDNVYCASYDRGYIQLQHACLIVMDGSSGGSQIRIGIRHRALDLRPTFSYSPCFSRPDGCTDWTRERQSGLERCFVYSRISKHSRLHNKHNCARSLSLKPIICSYSRVHASGFPEGRI
jgi:hypothetical protein